MAEPKRNPAREKLCEVSRILARAGENMLRLDQEWSHLRHFAHHDELTGLSNRA